MSSGGLRKRSIELLPEFFWVFVEKFGVSIAGILGIKLLTNVLGPEEFGRLALANTITMLIAINIFGPLGNGCIRFWSVSQDRKELDVFYYLLNQFIKSVSLGAFFVVIMLSVGLGAIRGFDWSLLVLLAVIVGTISGVARLRTGILTAMRKRRYVAILSTLNVFSRPVIATLLVVLISAKASVALFGYCVAVFIVFFITERKYFKVISKNHRSLFEKDICLEPDGLKHLRKELLIYSWPFIIWGIFGWVYAVCDRWVMQSLYGAEIVGLYAVVAQLAVSAMTFISSFWGTFFAPIAFQKAGDLKNKKSRIDANKILGVMTGTYVLVAATVVLGFAIFHKPLILLISNKVFLKFSWMLPQLAIAWALFHLGQLLTYFGLLVNKSRVYIIPKIITATIAGIGVLGLTIKNGPIGVVWGLLISGGIYALWCFLIAMRFVVKTREI